MKKKKPRKETTSLRVDPKKREQVESLGFNIGQVLDLAIDQLLGDRRCPMCKQKLPD